jgi:hypothetical protein
MSASVCRKSRLVNSQPHWTTGNPPAATLVAAFQLSAFRFSHFPRAPIPLLIDQAEESLGPAGQVIGGNQYHIPADRTGERKGNKLPGILPGIIPIRRITQVWTCL